MKFANNLKSIRENKSLSQSEFSKIIGVSESALSQYERGGRSPSAEILVKIATKLNISCDYLLGIKLNNYDVFSCLKESDKIVVLKLIDVLKNK